MSIWSVVSGLWLVVNCHLWFVVQYCVGFGLFFGWEATEEAGVQSVVACGVAAQRNPTNA
jgi:hypothetical protein